MNSKEIFNTRTIQAPIAEVYRAFADPKLLAKWWGPEGFTNTIHEFDLRPGGRWSLTMHGPEKGNYENASVFNRVESNRLVSWTRKTQPYFDMEIVFTEKTNNATEISFRMIFATQEDCDKVRKFAEPKNEENFDRLERLLTNPQ